jgi:membrane protein
VAGGVRPGSDYIIGQRFKIMRQLKTIGRALYGLFEHSGFSMAGAVAFSFTLSLFPFSIFLAALSATLGGPELAKSAVDQLFQLAPKPVAETLAPEVERVMSQSRYGLLTLGAGTALIFATSAIESLRAALNVAYRVKETRSYFWCLAQSSLFVLVSALGALVLAWGIVVGPSFAAGWKPNSLLWLANDRTISRIARYVIVVVVIGLQLIAYHKWLAAGHRKLQQILPGVFLSIVLWLVAANLYASYLNFYDYSRFYAGLTQIMSALIFFQVAAIIIILGAELNRGIADFKKLIANGQVSLEPLTPTADPPPEAPPST